MTNQNMLTFSNFVLFEYSEVELCIIPKFHVESHDPEHLDIPHHNIDLRISKSSIKYQNILILLVWARHSKMHHGVFFFSRFFRKRPSFCSFKVVEKRSTRHLKAEIFYF